MVMTAKHIHPLLIRGRLITEDTAAWILKDHPHRVAGCRRGFEVRVYHYPAEGLGALLRYDHLEEGMGDGRNTFTDGRSSRIGRP
jgi:hypothetical protein